MGKFKLDTYNPTNNQGTFDIMVIMANYKPFTGGLPLAARHVSR